MKTVFCIDDSPGYLLLLKVAVRSLRAVHGPDAPCLCVYGGDKAEVLQSLAAEAIPVARHQLRLPTEKMTPLALACRGCFLKLELAILPELAGDDAVLYCDADVLFRQPLDALFSGPLPPYMGMVREHTAPFWHEHQRMEYLWRGHRHVVPMPFPIWTFSSGVVLFNLERLRRRDLIGHFLAFAGQNVDKIGNLDQSLLNYFFGKRITRLDERWNCPPYLTQSLEQGHIVHFHGAKPWDTTSAVLKDLRINHFETLRQAWFAYLRPDEREQLAARFQRGK
ncbi:MAG: glycosyl transferase [Desulfovibrio sp.]|nr:glycosyl transferase [Desulfovibrio sp.]